MPELRKLMRATLADLMTKLPDRITEVREETLITTAFIVQIRLAPSKISAPIPLTRAEAEVLAGCSSEPHTAKEIAHDLDRVCNSYFRSLLSRLVDKERLKHIQGVYSLPPANGSANN